jgi:DNA-binding response OmpR family regulator
MISRGPIDIHHVASLVAMGAVVLIAEHMDLVRSWITTPSEAETGLGPLLVGDLEIDQMARRVSCVGLSLGLTAIEFRLLWNLAQDTTRVWTFVELEERVWQSTFLGDSSHMRSTVTRIRSKLRLSGTRAVIEAIRGVGFRLNPQLDLCNRSEPV